MRQTKPIWRPGSAKVRKVPEDRCGRLYKQSQFSGGRALPGWSGHPIVRNKANRRRQSCETKPISPGGQGRGRPGGRSCQIKPNLGRMGHLEDNARRGPRVQNKPNLPIADWGQVCSQTPPPLAARLRQVGCTNKPNSLGRIVQNKPNCPKRGTEAVSESWPVGEIPIIPLLHRSSIPVLLCTHHNNGDAGILTG